MVQYQMLTDQNVFLSCCKHMRFGSLFGRGVGEGIYLVNLSDLCKKETSSRGTSQKRNLCVNSPWGALP